MADQPDPLGLPLPVTPAQNAVHPEVPPLAAAVDQPGQQGLLLPPPLAAPEAAAGQATTFAQLYQDIRADPLVNSYAAVLARFDAMVEEPQDPDELLSLALENPSLPNTFLCCARLHTNMAVPRIYVVHKLSKYPRSFAGTVTPWDDRLFAFLGDTIGNSIQTITLPRTLFNLTPVSYVYDDATLAAEFPQLAPEAVFPRQVAGPHTTPIRTRYMTYLPTRYAPLFLDNRGVTPKEAWSRLIPALQRDGLLGIATSLVNWLRVSIHATHNGPPPTTSPVAAPLQDQDLYLHRRELLYNSIPNLRPGVNLGYDPALMHLATAVATQATEARNDRLAREVERERPTLPSAKFNLLYPTLQSLLSVQDEQDLPEFWFSFANATKKQEFGVLKQALDAYAKSDTAFVPQAPIPTPKLVADLTTVTLVADHKDDLKSGLQPFIVMDGSEEFRLASLKVAQSYMALSEQQIGLKLSDLAQLDVPKDLRSHPTNFYGLEKSLGLFGNLIGTILGNTHPITTTYRSFWKGVMGRQKEQLHYEIDERKVIKPVHILRNIQLIVFDWFQAKLDGETPPTPPFQDILTRISLSLYSNPTLPGALYQLVCPRPTTHLAPQPTPTMYHDASSVASGLSTLSPSVFVPTPTVHTGPGSINSTPSLIMTTTTTSGRSGTYSKNPQVDRTLQGLLPPGVKILELLGSDPVPTGDDNNPICLAWHIRGGCFSNCRRRQNHEKALSAAEKQKLSNWVVDQTAKLRAKFAAP